MNRTQELITNSYSIGHAAQTIEELLKNTLYQIMLYEHDKMQDSETYKKLVLLKTKLEALLANAKEVHDFINKIDQREFLT